MTKTKGFNLITVLIIVFIVSIVSGITSGVIVYNNNRIADNVTYNDLIRDKELLDFLKVYADIDQKFFEKVDKSVMIKKAIDAMMSYLGDDYSSYLDGTETNELLKELAGEYKGIGIALDNETKTISRVFENTPASKAGLTIGDIIVGFNETDVTNMSATDITDKIKNANGAFTLKLKRGENVIAVSLKNETIISPNIDYRLVADHTNIGYLKIDCFSKTLGTQVKNALKHLEDNNINSLIIDLRDNTGGYLTAAEEVSSLFLEKNKTIYSLNYKNEVTSSKDKTEEHRNYKIAILMNNNTASASEVLAATLRDNNGAKLVGETSFGKGKVQDTMQMQDGSMVKYTSAYWLTPKGVCIDGIGLEPDYYVSNNNNNNDANFDGEIDYQLDKAVNILIENGN